MISPASLEGRSYHTTAIVRRDSTHCKLVHYGGVGDGELLADTTVVDMGERLAVVCDLISQACIHT